MSRFTKMPHNPSQGLGSDQYIVKVGSEGEFGPFTDRHMAEQAVMNIINGLDNLNGKVIIERVEQDVDVEDLKDVASAVKEQMNGRMTPEMAGDLLRDLVSSIDKL